MATKAVILWECDEPKCSRHVYRPATVALPPGWSVVHGGTGQAHIRCSLCTSRCAP